MSGKTSGHRQGSLLIMTKKTKRSIFMGVNILPISISTYLTARATSFSRATALTRTGMVLSMERNVRGAFTDGWLNTIVT